jgi:hypothetical protein
MERLDLPVLNPSEAKNNPRQQRFLELDLKTFLEMKGKLKEKPFLNFLNNHSEHTLAE